METPNLDYIKELSEGDADFEDSIITVLKKEFPEELALFKKNLESKNYTDAANNVHKIKHKISILGMKKSFEFASHYENNLRKGEIQLSSKFLNILHKIHVYLGC